jgi:hypothetical protein
MAIAPIVTPITPAEKVGPSETANAEFGNAGAAEKVGKEYTILLTPTDRAAQVTTEVDPATPSPSLVAVLPDEAVVEEQPAVEPGAAKPQPARRRLIYLAGVLLVVAAGIMGVLALSSGQGTGTPPAIIPEVEYMSDFETSAVPQRAVDFYRADGNIENAVDAGVQISVLYIDETGKWVWVRYANNDRSGWVSVRDLDFANPQDIDKLPTP